MKMTMHIDDKLLARVMKATGASSKTHAIDLALREIDRRAELARLTSEGLGLTATELKDAFDPASADAPEEVPQVPVSYGRKSRPRR
jgi:Arc/MetJ family transcription regulator